MLTVDRLEKAALAAALESHCSHGEAAGARPVCSGCAERVIRFLSCRLEQAIALLEGPPPDEDWSAWRSRSVAFTRQVIPVQRPIDDETRWASAALAADRPQQPAAHAGKCDRWRRVDACRGEFTYETCPTCGPSVVYIRCAKHGGKKGTLRSLRSHSGLEHPKVQP